MGFLSLELDVTQKLSYIIIVSLFEIQNAYIILLWLCWWVGYLNKQTLITYQRQTELGLAFSYLPCRWDPPTPLKNVQLNWNTYIYDERGLSIGTPIYMDFVHIIFFFPIVTPPLTWLFLLEHRYI